MIKKILQISIAILCFLQLPVNGQDLPLFTQKITNSFMYNPAMAGNGKGSLTFSNRRFWNNVPGSPNTNFLSVHMPLAYHKMGLGFNLLQERVGVNDNLYFNGAYAYHIAFSDDAALSMGLLGEYTNLRLNPARYDVLDESDPLLVLADARNSFDVSFGLAFRSRFLDLGLSANRLLTAFQMEDFATSITQFYTGYIGVKAPLAEDHLIEPIFTYRQLTNISAQWDLGLFYTFRDAFMLGASYRQGGVLSPSVSMKFQDRFVVGYSFEMFGTGALRQDVGGTNEITLRFDFWDDSYARNQKNSGAMMRNSVAFRRKTMTTNTFRSKPLSATSKKYKKRLKRNYTKSPNYRMSRSSKLNTVKRKKSIFGRKKGSSSRKIKSRRKRNSKTYKKKRKKSSKRRR